MRVVGHERRNPREPFRAIGDRCWVSYTFSTDSGYLRGSSYQKAKSHRPINLPLSHRVQSSQRPADDALWK